MLEYNTLKIILSLISCFLFMGFCILDGFDIGACILLPFVGKDDIDKRIIINSIAPHWDGNQVWFVTFIGLILSSFPIIYSTILNCLYNIVTILIISLILRPISLDFRSKINNNLWKKIFDILLFLSSFLIIFTIGLIIGIIIQGIPFSYDRNMNLNRLNNKININFFSIITSILFVINSLIQGSIYLQIKTKDYLYKKFNYLSNIFIIIQFIISIIFVIYIINIINGYYIFDKFAKNIFFVKNLYIIKNYGWKLNYINNNKLIIFPIFYIISSIFTFIFNKLKKNIISIILSSINIILLIIFIYITMFPFIIPCSYNANFSLTIWNSASNKNILELIIIFVLIIKPIIIFYTIFSFNKMKGKIDRNFIENNKNILY